MEEMRYAMNESDQGDGFDVLRTGRGQRCSSHAQSRQKGKGKGSVALEFERGRIDAVTQAGGRRTVREDVAEMGAAFCAGDFGTVHAVAAVIGLFDQVVV